jgi:hypothetical protein
MTVRQSTGLRDLLCSTKGFSGIFANGEIRIYSGAQPATADAAPTGVLLGVVTKNADTRTPETPASQTITVAGSAGSIDAVTVGGLAVIQAAVPFDTDASTTATNLAAAVNSAGICTATVSGAVVTVRAPAGMGTAWNGASLATSTTTLTATSGGNLSGGVAAVNGLQFLAAVNGVVTKNAEDWKFDGVADGAAGWFRLVGNGTDAGGTSTTLPRLDGSIGATGDMVLASTAITTGAPNTIDAFSYTIPAQ